MQSLHKNEIPEYLKNSEFYKNIESDGQFEIPINYYKKEIVINSIEDLISYIKIIHYWLVNKTPDEIYKWVFDNKDKIKIDDLNEINFIINHKHLINEFDIIINSTNDNICVNVAGKGYLSCLKWAHGNGCAWNGYKICEIVASHGYLDCLKYAHEKYNFFSKKLYFTS